jgi:hypothetical protein
MGAGHIGEITKEAQDLQALLCLCKTGGLFAGRDSSNYCATLKLKGQTGSKLSLHCWVNGPTDLIQPF